MANVDLHGVEFKSIDSPLPPLAVGLTTTVGLVGAAPDAAGEQAAVTVGAGDAAFTVTAADVGEDGDDFSIAVAYGANIGVAAASKAITVTAVQRAQASKVFGGAGNKSLTVTANAYGPAGNTITVTLATSGQDNSQVAVAVAARAITATFGTRAHASEVVTAINNFAGAAALVTASDGGNGVPDANAAANLVGGADGSTAAAVRAAINARDSAAAALVSASLPAGSDGSGLVAAVAATPLEGGEDPELALGTPTLLETAAQIAAIGDAGSLAKAVRDVFRAAGRGGATVVVVRTADDAAATLAGSRDDRSGVYALLTAESETGQRPRLLAAPGAKDASVTTALEAVASELRGVGVVTLDAATAAVAAASTPNSPHILACWPELMISASGAVQRRPADALVIGHVVRTDREASFAASPSNRQMLGVLRPAVAVEWALSSRTTAANTLNQANVATFVRRGNAVYLWGNRLSDGEFITRRRAEEIISDEVASTVLDYVDRRVDLPFVEHVLGRLGGYLRNLVTRGDIRAGRAWFDPAFNTKTTLAAGQVTFSYEITPHEIAEMITFRASIGSVPSEVLAGIEAGS